MCLFFSDQAVLVILHEKENVCKWEYEEIRSYCFDKVFKLIVANSIILCIYLFYNKV